LCHHSKIQLGYGIWGSSKPQLPGTALCSVEKQKQNKISKLVKDCHTSTQTSVSKISWGEQIMREGC
jgi:hypothetical protein